MHEGNDNISEKDNICEGDNDVYEEDSIHKSDNNKYEDEDENKDDIYDGSNIDNNDTDNVEDIETSEAKNHNYNLCFLEQMEQITLIDARINLFQSFPSFSDTVYIEFIKIVSIYHLL